MDDKNVKNYAAYLDAIISSRKSKLQHSFAPVKGLSVRVLDHNGDIIAIEIDQKSPYWPKKDNLLNRLTQTLSFEIYLRKDPIKPELLNPAIVGDYGNDLIVWATEPLAWPNNVIWVDYPSKKLSIHSSGDYLKKLWHTTGRIASVQDLFGAQLFLRLPAPPEIYDLINSLDIKTITLELAPGRTFSIGGEKFNKVRLSDGSLVLSIILPKTEKELFFGLGRD